MARGKHKQRAENQRARRADSQAAALRVELEREQARLAGLKPALDQLAKDRMVLSGLLEERDRSVAGEVARLTAVEVAYQAEIEREQGVSKTVSRIWERIAETVVAISGRGSGVEGIEGLFRLLGNLSNTRILSDGNPFDEKQPLRTVAALQRARGQRQSIPENLGERDPYRLVTRSVRARIASNPNLDRKGRALSRSLTSATPFHRDRNTVAAWAFTDLVGYTAETLTGTTLQALGSVLNDRAAWTAAEPSADPTAHAGEALAERDPRLVREAARWTTPRQRRALFPRPSDAIATRWWYWLSAASAEVRFDENTVDPSEPVAGLSDTELLNGTWPPNPISDPSAMCRDAASMIATAVPFWLPPGQAALYLDSEPLTPEDRDLVRLPYRRVLVVPSEPLWVPPSDTDANEDDMRTLEDVAVTSAAEQHADSHSIKAVATFNEVLDTFGGYVEAVVLEADAAGRPTDRVVWCIAIPTRNGDGIITRTVVPALASRSVWADQLDYIATVVAFGDWTEHPTDDAPTTKGPGPGHTDPPSAIHVLSVRTRPADPGHTAEPTGRTLAPHRRRGHWRRQHHGPGGRDIKLVRIAPVLVNASHGPLVPQIYRLPTPQAEPPDQAASGTVSRSRAPI